MVDWAMFNRALPQLLGVSQCPPNLRLTSLLLLQGYHRSNHFIATQGELSPSSSLCPLGQWFCSSYLSSWASFLVELNLVWARKGGIGTVQGQMGWQQC